LKTVLRHFNKLHFFNVRNFHKNMANILNDIIMIRINTVPNKIVTAAIR
jgi:hypothetical protein